MSGLSDSATTERALSFGPFQLFPARRLLLEIDQPVPLGARAFDVLVALVQARGRLVTKDEIMTRVWPGAVVEENNLQVQISALRKALGEDRDFIRTDSGRGYRFVGVISAGREMPATAAAAATNLPAPISALIGRDDELASVADLISTHRLVTLTGAGGIGKTRLGTEAARRLLPTFADGVWIAELASLSDPGLVAATVAAALGLKLGTGAATPERLAAALGSKRLLLVLDNCEHLIDAAAGMAEALLRASPTIRVMVTSREPLGSDGETVFPLPPLAVPTENDREAERLLQHGAVRLFFDRARAADLRFAPDTQLTAVVGAICRRLDGNPLAIELAASRVATLGLKEIAARLDDRFRLLAGGRRTALPRHRMLRATLDWSHDLLPAAERAVLRRLAIFAGSFSLEAAGAVASGDDLGVSEVTAAVANLVVKSLLAADPGKAMTRYRLLETTRAYALEKLAASGEREPLSRRHAECQLDLLERVDEATTAQSDGLWAAAGGRGIADVRAALNWAFSATGDASIGIALTAAAVPLWFHLSSIEECRQRVEQALASLAAAPEPDTRRELQLVAALGAALTHTKGLVAETELAWKRVLEIANGLEDAGHRLQALFGRWSYCYNSGDFPAALTLARQFSGIAAERADPTDRLIGERMIGVAQHYLGNQAEARRHMERALAGDLTAIHRTNTVRALFDHRSRAYCTLARALWLQGFPDRAMRTVDRAIEATHGAIDEATALCYVLSQGGAPLAYIVGDLAAGKHFVTMLLDRSTRSGFAVWQARAHCFAGVMRIATGDAAEGVPQLRAALDELHDKGSALNYMGFFATLSEGLGAIGQTDEGLAVIDAALARAERFEERWCMAELLRIRGRLLLAQGRAIEAEVHFHQALDWARRQGALSWELRAATSLAGLWRSQKRARDALKLLAPVYDRFTEGFATKDLKAAESLLDDLR